MTQRDELGCHLIGYFSKEKESSENYNLACILTLPQFQRSGFGRLLIQFSYELSKVEGRTGSPEKPLSDLGLLSYRAYWTETIVELLLSTNDEITIEEISQRTSITPQDILHTLQNIGALKYYRGQHIICLGDKVVDNWEKGRKKKRRIIAPEKLDWKPMHFTPSQLRFL
jgi:histone acetyltransferase HTATIP